MEKSRVPTFSGKTIDYPEFKRGWKKAAGICWEDNNQVKQIKLMLDFGSSRVTSSCSTVAEAWTPLDTAFPQKKELINAVDKELSKLLNLHWKQLMDLITYNLQIL